MTETLIQMTEWSLPDETIVLTYVYPAPSVERVQVIEWLKREQARIATDPTRQAKIRRKRGEVALFVNQVVESQ